MPIFGLLSERRTSVTSPRQRSRSPGRTGALKRMSPQPGDRLNSISVIARHCIMRTQAIICSPLAISPPMIDASAAASSRWKGSGS